MSAHEYLAHQFVKNDADSLAEQDGDVWRDEVNEIYHSLA